MDSNKATTNWIIAGLVALAVIIGGGWLISRDRVASTDGTNATSTAATSTSNSSSSATNASANGVRPTPTVSVSGEDVMVLEQPAGDYAIVVNVKVKTPTWIAVQDLNGWILGAAWVSEDTKTEVIHLLRKTVPGETYRIVMFVDDGDKVFTLHGGDKSVIGPSGAQMIATFKTH